MAAVAGEQVPLWPGVHILDEPLPNGFAAETRLNVDEDCPLCSPASWRPESQSGPQRGVRAVGELRGGVTGALIDPLWTNRW